MGRSRQTLPPLDVEIVREAFALRQDGQIVRRGCRVAALDGEPATFTGPGGKLLVRVYVNGKIRRTAAGRVAWAFGDRPMARRRRASAQWGR